MEAVSGTVGVAAIYSGLHSMSRYVKEFEERYNRANVSARIPSSQSAWSSG